MTLQDLFLHILYCKHRESYGGDNAAMPFERLRNHHELILITKASGTIVVNHKRFPLREGTLLYICPDVRYEVEFRTSVPASLIAVHFDCVSVCFADGKWEAAPTVKQLPAPPVLQLADYRPVAELFKRLMECWDTKLPGYEFTARTYLQELLLTVYADVHKENRNYAMSDKIEKVIRYMHEHLTEQLTLAEVASLVRLSPAYLTRSFKEATGYSVIEYFNRIKVDRAKELLMESDNKVKEIAQALGFADEFYFSRIFRKSAGVSPTEYRSKIVHEF